MIFVLLVLTPVLLSMLLWTFEPVSKLFLPSQAEEAALAMAAATLSPARRSLPWMAWVEAAEAVLVEEEARQAPPRAHHSPRVEDTSAQTVSPR